MGPLSAPGFAFVLVGFGTKVGLVPMHAWLPDAHSEGPSPISAMLSGALLAAALYAVLRIGAIAQLAVGPTYVHVLLLVFGALSLLLAALFALRQTNYKRLLAYSSIEHMGIVSLGIGIGGPVAAYGAFFHVLVHAAGKTLAFFGAGGLLSRYETREADGVRGVIRAAPFTGVNGLVGSARDYRGPAVRDLPIRAVDRHRRLLALALRACRAARGVRERCLRRGLPDVSPDGAVAGRGDRGRPDPARSSRATADGGGDAGEPYGRAGARALDPGPAKPSAARSRERDRGAAVIALEDRAVEVGALATELKQLDGRLMVLFATGSAGAQEELCALVRAGDAVIKLRAPVQRRAYPAVTPMVPAAHWFEREIHDLQEITPEGHPRLEPLVRHPPEQRELELPEEEDVRLAHRGAERLAGPGVFVIPYGPVRSGVFESAQFLVQTGGEDVAYCAQRLFFKRRGAERRICEVPLELAVLVAERVSGTSSVAHALAFSHAVESLAETEVPPRAQAIRRMLAELERLYNHLEVTVRECEDASLSVGHAQFAALKERLHRLAGAVVGNRYLRGAVIPGGTRIDLNGPALDLIDATLSEWEREWQRVLAVLLRTDSFLDRLVSAGPLSEDDARDFACVGPVARASGIDLDTRRDSVRRLPGLRCGATLRRGRDGSDGGSLPGSARLARVDPGGGGVADAGTHSSRVGAVHTSIRTRRGRVRPRRDALLA